MKAFLSAILIAAATGIFAGCATNDRSYAVGSPLAAAISGIGTIKDIREVSTETFMGSLKKRAIDNASNAFVGGLAGHFIKKKVQEGEDRPGAVAGSTTGRVSDIEPEAKLYQVDILMDDGNVYTFEKESVYGLKEGDRVRLNEGMITKI